jgi:hypothetical protein
MDWIGGVGLLFALSGLGTAIRVGRERVTTAKRTYLFETADGERANPFGAFSAGAADSHSTCRECRRDLPGEQYHYCLACLAAD